MNVLINHNGKTNAEILGADTDVVQSAASIILQRIVDGNLNHSSKIYEVILSFHGTNDAEKLCIFFIVNKTLAKFKESCPEAKIKVKPEDIP